MNTLTPTQRNRVLALLRQGKTLRRIQAETGHRRETIAAYGRRAGLLGGDISDLDAIRDSASIWDPMRDVILDGIADGMSLRALHGNLAIRYGFIGSYSGLKRYVRSITGDVRAQNIAA